MIRLRAHISIGTRRRPLRPEAREAMLAALDFVGNPSSVHGEGAPRARRGRGCARGDCAAGRREAGRCLLHQRRHGGAAWS